MTPIESLAASVAVPAIHLVATEEASRSYLGGEPRLPPGVAWPRCEGRQQAFMARVSLAELAQTLAVDWLPKEGALLFFYDHPVYGTRERHWIPGHQHWAVLGVSDLEAPLVPSRDQAEGGLGARRNLVCRVVGSLPSIERLAEAGIDVSEEDEAAYWDVQQAVFGDRPMHQVAGVPCSLQGDYMEWTCQLEFHGLFGSRHHNIYDDPRAKALKAGASDWRLLLQLDTDAEGWHDGGSFFFWVREREAVAGRFENAWMQFQCY